MSNETGLFSSLLNKTMAADSKKEERVGGYSQEIALNSLSYTEKLKNKFRSAGQHLFFASRSIFHYRKKHTRQSQHFPLYSRSQLAHSGEASSEPVILSRAEPCFIVHGTSWKGAIVGCGEYSHSIPVKGKLSGLSPTQQSPGGRQRGEEVELRANWNPWSVSKSKESEDTTSRKGIYNVCVCVQKDPDGLGAGHMSGEKG